MAAARIHRRSDVARWPALVWWSALSLLPDLDVIGFRFGVAYGDPWGHRGAAHSIAFAVVMGLAVSLLARRSHQPVRRLALFAILVIVSHGLLDTMTDGGLGIALLWPFSDTRYFAPWRPIPVAPIGAAFFTRAGAAVALTEVALFAPLLGFALWPGRPRPGRVAVAMFLGVWVASVWLIASTDRVRDALVGVVLREDTAYAERFSEEAFGRIRPGDSEAAVRQSLGAPYGESWFYAPRGQGGQRAASLVVGSLPSSCLAMRFERGAIVTAFDVDACKRRGIERGTSIDDVRQRLGAPSETCWRYTWSPGGAYHRLRVVCFANGQVETVIRRWTRFE